MAFPSSTGSVPLTLEAAWELARLAAANIKAGSQQLSAAAQSGNVGADRILAFANFLAAQNAQLSRASVVGGIVAYAQAQVNEASLDVAGAFSAMQTALVNTVAWIIANFPQDGSANLLAAKFNVDGTLAYTQFTSAQLGGFVTQLGALIATID